MLLFSAPKNEIYVLTVVTYTATIVRLCLQNTHYTTKNNRNTDFLQFLERDVIA